MAKEVGAAKEEGEIAEFQKHVFPSFEDPVMEFEVYVVWDQVDA